MTYVVFWMLLGCVALHLADHHRLRLLRLLGCPVLPVDGLFYPGQLHGRTRLSEIHVTGSQAGLPYRAHRHRSGPARFLQVCRFPAVVGRRPLPRDGHRLAALQARRHSSHRHLVLYVSHDQLHRRLLPRHDQADPQPVRVLSLRLSVLAVGGRAPSSASVRSNRDLESLGRRADRRRWLDLGLSFFVYGLAEKVLLADTLATFVDPAWKQYDQLSSLGTWLAVLGYSFQLYFDFSGYSTMAVGLGYMFGIRIPQNFNSPYKALDPSDFWQRWHISLSACLRDYLYIPLGGIAARPGRPTAI